MPSSAARRLLSHYDAHARPLPWRSPPGTAPPDPYRVWLSEVMLQQTTVATVTPRFRRFLQRWPSVEALAAAPLDAVLHEWAGLGYYARARNLHACAQAIAALGGFPVTEAALRTLPGIGAYTAAAIAAIAFAEPVTAVDTNVERVIARINGLDAPLAEMRPEIRRLARAMLPRNRPGDFAQAMMDLGATICRPRNPDCLRCPLAGNCAAFASGEPARFPAPKAKTLRPQRFGTAWWIERDGALWLVRRPAKGLLGGMPALPGPAWHDQPAPGPSLALVQHHFTHFTIDLTIVPRTVPPDGPGWWQPIDRIADAGLPTLYARAVAAILLQRNAFAA